MITANPPAITIDVSWGDGIAAIRAFLRSLPAEYRRGPLFLALLREVNVGTIPAPFDVKHPSAHDAIPLDS